MKLTIVAAVALTTVATWFLMGTIALQLVYKEMARPAKEVILVSCS